MRRNVCLKKSVRAKLMKRLQELLTWQTKKQQWLIELPMLLVNKNDNSALVR